MRSDNLRTAPAWITPQMVRQVLDLAGRAPPVPALMPVVPVDSCGRPNHANPAGAPRVKPTLRIVERETDTPAEHARRTEEAEAAAPAASPPRRKKSMAEKAAEFEARRGDQPVPAKIGPRVGRYANELALYEQPEFRTLAKIAFDRGIALIDLARALQKPVPTVLINSKRLDLHFGKRPPLADPLTKAVLLTLADQSVPLPELRRDRRRRERLADEQRAKICEAKHRTPRQGVRLNDRARPNQPVRGGAAPREPAPPAPQQARAQPLSDRAKIDAVNQARSATARRRATSTAEAFVDAGKSVGATTNPALKIAIRGVEARRAEDARLACPVEQAKTILRRRFAPVCSMAVWDGDPDLFCVGYRKNLTRAELLELAAKADLPRLSPGEPCGRSA